MHLSTSNPKHPFDSMMTKLDNFAVASVARGFPAEKFDSWPPIEHLASRFPSVTLSTTSREVLEEALFWCQDLCDDNWVWGVGFGIGADFVFINEQAAVLFSLRFSDHI